MGWDSERAWMPPVATFLPEEVEQWKVEVQCERLVDDDAGEQAPGTEGDAEVDDSNFRRVE